ncbi:hypothetical protein RIF29_21417 [Crotalaria pallida]|uniref:Uncharacterized protein n=1 Tax=Crotalaria pallida TaxID=3830 RepID=A0AAN9F7E1_CROPI
MVKAAGLNSGMIDIYYEHHVSPFLLGGKVEIADEDTESKNIVATISEGEEQRDADKKRKKDEKRKKESEAQKRKKEDKVEKRNNKDELRKKDGELKIKEAHTEMKKMVAEKKMEVERKRIEAEITASQTQQSIEMDSSEPASNALPSESATSLPISLRLSQFLTTFDARLKLPIRRRKLPIEQRSTTNAPTTMISTPATMIFIPTPGYKGEPSGSSPPPSSPQHPNIKN